MDQISHGRFEFGVGRSGNMRAYNTMGIDYDEPRALPGGPGHHPEGVVRRDVFLRGQIQPHYQCHAVTPPYQKPHPKVRIASTTEDSFSRVGRLGFPIFLSMRGMDVEDLETNLKDYHAAWQKAGHAGESGDISVRLPMYVALPMTKLLKNPRRALKPTSCACAASSRRAGEALGAEYWERRQNASNGSRNSPMMKSWTPKSFSAALNVSSTA